MKDLTSYFTWNFFDFINTLIALVELLSQLYFRFRMRFLFHISTQEYSKAEESFSSNKTTYTFLWESFKLKFKGVETTESCTYINKKNILIMDSAKKCSYSPFLILLSTLSIKGSTEDSRHRLKGTISNRFSSLLIS